MPMSNTILPKIQDAELKGKVVLVRVDHNVVKEGFIHDPYRIDATIGTLYHINARGGKIILMTHVGRPRDKKTQKISIDKNTSIQPIVDYLQTKLHIDIRVPEFYTRGDEGYLGIETSINHQIRMLRDGDIDGIYLPNTRWFSGEESGGETAERFAVQLSGLADVFVNDAFGSWQAHTSTVRVNKYLQSYAGYLMQKEIQNLQRIYDAQKPFIAVVAGSKMDTKIDSLFALLETADKLILGGVIYNAYLCAKYGVSIKGVSEENIEMAHNFLNEAEKHPGKLIELPFIVESHTMTLKDESKAKVHDVRELKKGAQLEYVLDVAPKSFELDEVRQEFLQAKTIFINAVMGYTPYFNQGTMALDRLTDENRDAVKLYGGGDTMQELKRLLPGLYIVALDHPKYYIFTGGGAVLKAIQEGTYTGLEPVKALIENAGE